MGYYFEDGEIFEINGKNYITCVTDDGHDPCRMCDIECNDCGKFDCLPSNREDGNYAFFVDIEKMPKQKVQDEPTIDTDLNYKEEYNILKEKYDALLEEMNQFKNKEHSEIKDYYDPVLEEIIIPELETWFNWAGVCKMMNSVNWTWAGEPTPLTIDIIKKRVYHEVRYAYKNKTTVVCGGFEIKYIPAKDAAMRFGFEGEEAEKLAKYDTIELSFIGDSWETSFCSDEDI